MKYAFAGNRGFVYWRMREMGLEIPHVFAVEGSFLQRELVSRDVPHEVLPTKAEFVTRLESLDFDVFLGNGCPIILPVSRLEETTGARYVNVHPSLLPALRGADPVPGAILFGEDSGATCHVMDDGIDTGPIISQVRIPMTDDLDAGLLYQLSFQAEIEAFDAACARDYQPDPALQPSPDEKGSYYTFSPEDLELDFAASDVDLIRKIKAFATQSKGAWFEHKGERFCVLGVEKISNTYACNTMLPNAVNQIAIRYEDAIVVRRQTANFKLRLAVSKSDHLRQGDQLI